jgi:CheY-like chemotaxis protein
MPTVLLVDDDENTTRAMTRLLERTGYTAVWLSTGAQALEALRDLQFDLVVLDWMMPEMDGLEVLRRLRDQPGTRNIPVVLYTAVDDPKVHREAERLGARACILKSGGFFPLYECIERLLPA